MKQTFNFDKLGIGDRIRFNGIVAEYTEHTFLDNQDGHHSCFYCVYQNIDCESIPCDDSHIWKKISKASWKEVTDEKK